MMPISEFQLHTFGHKGVLNCHVIYQWLIGINQTGNDFFDTD